MFALLFGIFCVRSLAYLYILNDWVLRSPCHTQYTSAVLSVFSSLNNPSCSALQPHHSSAWARYQNQAQAQARQEPRHVPLTLFAGEFSRDTSQTTVKKERRMESRSGKRMNIWRGWSTITKIFFTSLGTNESLNHRTKLSGKQNMHGHRNPYIHSEEEFSAVTNTEYLSPHKPSPSTSHYQNNHQTQNRTIPTGQQAGISKH